MQSPTIVATRGLLVAFTLFLFSTALMAQNKVVIKERLEINPKSNRTPQAKMSSSDLPCFAGVVNSSSHHQIITVLRPCIITATGTLTCEVAVNYYPCVGDYNVNNKIDTFSVNCGGIDVGDDAPSLSCGVIWDPCITTGSIGANSASFDISGQWSCYVENGHGIYPINSTFSISAVPIQGNPSFLSMSATDTVLDYYQYFYNCITSCGCDYSLCNQLGSGISAEWDDDTGNPFAYCCTKVLFTIEKPVNGVYFEWTDSAAHQGTSYEATYCGGIIPARLRWDGSDLPDDTCKISIRADGLGLSAVKSICLKKPLPYYFDVIPANSPISVGQSTAITVIGRNIDGSESSLNGSKLVTLTDVNGGGSFIVGSDTLLGAATVSYTIVRNGGVNYLPGISDFFDGGAAMISVCRTDYPERNGWGLIYVMPPCLVDSLSKSKISPGDTVTLKVMAQTDNGVFPYSSDQVFVVSMADSDARYGKLHCIATGDSGTTITGTQPFEFIAADKINVDSIVINISAYPVSNGGGGGVAEAIKGGQKDTLQRRAGLMLEKQIKPVGKNAVLNIDGTKNVLVSPQEKITKKLAEQNNVFAQKVAKKQALMNAITEAIKTQKAGKGDAASAKQLNLMVQDLAEGASCNPTAQLTIEGVELVVTPPKDTIQKIVGTDLPTMPKPVIRLQLKNYHNKTDDTVKFHYTLKIHWKSDVVNHPWETPKNKSEQYTGDTTGTNDQVINWKLNLDNFGMRGGNDISLIVTATTAVDGKVYKTNPDTLKNPFVIKGKNPVVATVLAKFKNHLYAGYTVDNYAAVAWDESRFNQFSTASSFFAHPHSTKPNYPLQGPPTGLGLMQIDPPPNDTIVWNWVANVQEGQRHFNTNIDAAKNYQNLGYFKENNQTPDSLKNVPTSTDTTQNQVFLQAYCFYNNGSARYWDWVDPTVNKQGETLEPGHWIKNTKTWNINGKGPVAHTNAVWTYFISKSWNH